MFTKNKIDPKLNKKLSLLKEVPERSAENIAKGRSAFLKEAHQYKVKSSGVIGQRQLNQSQKKMSLKSVFLNWHPQMLKVAIPIILAIAVIFGTGWMVARVSQGSQPDQFLYSVKLASEEMALSMASSPADQFDLSSAYMQNRATEIIVLFNSGESPSDETIQRFGAQVDDSIALAAGMDDAQAVEALGRVQTRLETQIQAIKLLKVDSLSDAGKSREKVLTVLQEKLDIVIKGKGNLAWLREKLKEESQSKSNSKDSGSPTPTLTPDVNSNSQPTETSIHGNSQATHTRTPGAGNNQGGGNSGNSEKTKTPPGNSQGGKKTPTSTPAPTDEGSSATATPKNGKNK